MSIEDSHLNTYTLLVDALLFSLINFDLLTGILENFWAMSASDFMLGSSLLVLHCLHDPSSLPKQKVHGCYTLYFKKKEKSRAPYFVSEKKIEGEISSCSFPSFCQS